jgi:cold shock CspA family protein
LARLLVASAAICACTLSTTPQGEPVQHRGTTCRLLIDKGYGFIVDRHRVAHFFTRRSVRGAVFELLREGQAVSFRTNGEAAAARAYEVRLIESTRDSGAGQPLARGPRPCGSTSRPPEVARAAESVFAELTGMPRTLLDLRKLRPAYRLSLLDAAIQSLIEDERIEEFLGDGSPERPFVYLEVEILEKAIERIEQRLGHGRRTRDGLERMLREFRPPLVAAVLDSLVEAHAVTTTRSAAGDVVYEWVGR